MWGTFSSDRSILDQLEAVKEDVPSKIGPIFHARSIKNSNSILMFQYELFRPTYHACSATSGLHVIQARFRFHIVPDLFLPVVQWRLLAGWYHGLISLSFHLAFEIRLRICNELGMQEQIRAGKAESLCRHDHSFLTNTHARAGSRLPSMWNHSRHECCREKADLSGHSN